VDTSIRIAIRGDLDYIFDLAAKVENWAQILPHYRYVKLLKREGDRKWVRMSAWRDIIPVTWTAIQTVERGAGRGPGRILFSHTGGLVRGMEVAWWFEPRPEKGDVVVGINGIGALPDENPRAASDRDCGGQGIY
jgi:hypothetical protein